MKNIKNKRLIVLFVIALIVLSFMSVSKMFQGDTYTNLITGEYIANHGIDKTEPFTIHEGLEYIKVRYAFDLLVYFTYHFMGFFGLYLFVIIMSIAIALTIFYILNKTTKSIFISFLLTVLAIIVMKDYLICRAQIVSYLILIIEVFILEKLAHTGEKKYSIILTLLSVVVLAFHSPVWIVYLVFFMPYFAEYIISKFYKKISWLDKHYQFDKIFIKNILVTFVLVILTGFLTPNGLSPFTYSLKNVGSIGKDMIVELKLLDQVRTSGVAVVVGVAFATLVVSKAKIKPADVFYLLGCSLMSVLAVRNFYIAVPIIAIMLGRVVYCIIKTYHFEKKIEDMDTACNKETLIQVVLYIGLIVVFAMGVKSNMNRPYIDPNICAVGPVNYLKEHNNADKVVLCTSFNNGPFIEYSGFKAYIDGRSEIYCPEFNEVNVLEEWYNFKYGEIDESIEYTKKLVDKYNFTHFICETDQENIDTILSDPMFEELYRDKYFVLIGVNDITKN